MLNTEEMELSSLGKVEERNKPENQDVNAPGESWTTDMIILDDITAKAKETKQIIGFDEGLI